MSACRTLDQYGTGRQPENTPHVAGDAGTHVPFFTRLLEYPALLGQHLLFIGPLELVPSRADLPSDDLVLRVLGLSLCR